VKTKSKPVRFNHTSGSVPAREETRERLLDAAQKVFVEVGFYDATVREICKRARVNLALVNYHFGDKLQLYMEVLRRCMSVTKLDVLKKANDPEVDPVALLRELVTQFLRAKKKDTDHDILMHQESLRPTPAMEFITEKTMRPAYEAVCTVVGRILELPGSHEAPRLITHSVIGQLKHFGEPDRLLTRLDPTILSGKTDEEIADFIISFALAASYKHGATNEVVKPQQAKTRSKSTETKLQSVEP